MARCFFTYLEFVLLQRESKSVCLSLFRVLPHVTFTHSSSYILDGLDSMHSTSSIDITHLEHTAQAQCNFLLSISHDNLQFREFSRST